MTVEPGAIEHRVARGALLQQVAQVWGTLCMLAMITVLARRLGLTEFGVFGLFVSVAGYLLILQLSIEGAAVRAIAGAPAAADRERVFTTAIRLYAAGGVLAAIVIAGLGILLAGVLGIPEDLQPEARVGILVLAGLTALGWPAKVFQDLLRGMQLFGAAALAEMLAYTLVCGGVIAMAYLDAPLSLLIGLGGGLSATVGFWCAAIARAFRVPIPYRRGAGDRSTMRELLGVSGYLLVSGLANLFIYSVDRVILAAYKGAAAVGLYEAAVRPHNVVRTLHGTLVLTVMPVAAALRAGGDRWRNQQLLVRGTRYVLAIVAPVATTLVVLAAPILEVWLGRRYTPAASALAILAAYWIPAGGVGVATAMLLAAGRVRALATYAWAGAAGNLLIALPLTPSLGLSGVALGIAVPPVLLMPWLYRIVLDEFGVSARELALEAFLPAAVSCAALAVVVLALRGAVQPHSLLSVGALALLGLGAAFALYWFVWLDESERALVRSLIRWPPARTP